MKRFYAILFFAIVMTLGYSVSAQDYKSAVGGRLGYGLLGTYKSFINDDLAYEVSAGLRWSGLAGGLFIQKHADLEFEDVENLRWFVGGGATITTWNYGAVINNSNYYELAIHANLGIEYTFEDMPIVVGLDYAPGIVILDSWDFIGSYNRVRLGYGSLFARYILGGGGF